MPDNATPTNDPLDSLFKEVTGDEPSDTPKPGEQDTPPADPPAPAPIDKKEDPKPLTPPPTDKKDEPQPPVPPAPPAPTDFEKVELPPYSKPKTGEAFETVKRLAREQISAKDAEIERLKKEVADRDTKLKAGPPPEVTKELEELRTFRRSVDIENDPDFRSRFEGKIESNTNAIYTKLLEVGMTQNQIDEIKKLGVEIVDWDPIFEKLPSAAKRFIETKLVANEDLRNEKKTEVEKARKNPSVFETQKAEGQSRRIVETANGFLAKMAWTAPKEVPATAKPEEKAQIEADNKFAQETQVRLQESLKNYSPEAFAEAVIGTQMAYKFKRDLDVLAASSKTLENKLNEVTKERDEAKAELDRIKKAGQTHRRTSTTPPPPVVNNLVEPGRVALDRLFEEASR